MILNNKTFSERRPLKYYHKGNTYTYNFNIEKDTQPTYTEVDGQIEVGSKNGYSYVPIVITSIIVPDYNEWVKAVIRKYISAEDEFKLINSHNMYQLGVTDTVKDYQEYLELVDWIKGIVRTDFNHQSSDKVSSEPKQSDIIKLIQMTIDTMDLTDQQALSVKSLYPEWESFIGEIIQKDTKVKYENKLFKVVQSHLVQEQYPPSIETASLYTEIVEDHKGTKDDPIPYPADGNMVIYNGKYYLEDNILYKCIRDSGNPLYAQLKNLVGIYVELA